MSSVVFVYCLFLLCVHDCCSHTFLLATESCIKLLDGESSSTSTLRNIQVDAVDFRYTKGDVFFIVNNRIFYSYYSNYSKAPEDAIQTVQTEFDLNSLVVDWEFYKIYYSSKTTHAIYETTLLGSRSREIVSQVANVKDIAIDPYQRLLFFIEDNSLVSFELQNGNSYQHYFSKHSLSKISKMAVDHHKHILYIIGHDDEGRGSLLSTVYEKTYPESTLVFKGLELERPLALDVFNDEVIWVSEMNNKYIMFTCQLSPSCDLAGLKIVYESDEPINDVRYYNGLVQTPDTNYACVQLDCSHFCSVVSLYTVKCTCPPGMTIHDDDNKCRDLPQTTVEAHAWIQGAKKVFFAILEGFLLWLSSISEHIVTFVFVCCGLMLLLLLCGICILGFRRKPKYSVNREDSFYLSERNYQTSPTR